MLHPGVEEPFDNPDLRFQRNELADVLESVPWTYFIELDVLHLFFSNIDPLSFSR